jgi:integrase/recombinase XerD
VRELRTRPSRRGRNVVALDLGTGLANAMLQQRLVPARLFYGFPVEEGLRESNPVGPWPAIPSGGASVAPAAGGRALVPRMARLPWIPTEAEWLQALEFFRSELGLQPGDAGAGL